MPAWALTKLGVGFVYTMNLSHNIQDCMHSKLSAAWQKITGLAEHTAPFTQLDTLPVRHLNAAGLRLDYSKARIDATTIEALGELATAAQLEQKFASMFAGKPINHTENRAVLHPRLRAPNAPAEILGELDRFLSFAGQLRNSDNPTGNAITAIIHIGIGGSLLGPRLLYEALSHQELTCRFVANIDPAAIHEALAGLDPAHTLVVSVSKSGSTTETLENTKIALNWLTVALGSEQAARQLVVVSANPNAAAKFGCAPEQAFRIWDWVGGRYSLWSAVSVSVAAAIGNHGFRELLAGANDMDAHVTTSSGLQNMAVLLALLHIWNIMALRAKSHCLVAYQHRLRSLPAYLQQLVMESNGKSVSISGVAPAYGTEVIWWGGEGTNDQHSYFQLLLQGMQPVPADFILCLQPQAGEDASMHQQLVAHCLGQSRALWQGRNLQQAQAELASLGMASKSAEELAPHLVVPGGQPSNLIIMPRLSAFGLGALLSLYEHMTAACGWLWDINSFDQWGVELGKINFRQTLAALQQRNSKLDPPTDAIVQLIKDESA